MKRPYKTHTISKHDYPTRTISGSRGIGGSLILGSDTAQKALQARVGRTFGDNFIAKHTRGQWRWREYPKDSEELKVILERTSRKPLSQRGKDGRKATRKKR